MNWLSQDVGGTIEVEITFKCNLKCRHCNRFCNSEKQYNITRNVYEMNMNHINYLCFEIMRFPKQRFNTLRIIGGEPLMSNILNETISVFSALVKNGYIQNIVIVSNGTFPVNNEIKPYIRLLPEKLNSIFSLKGKLTKKEVYKIKDSKHRNISIVPSDYDLEGKLCDRVLLCGINYSIYGFSLCGPCLTPMILYPENHSRFLYEIPEKYSNFVFNNFEKNVCSKCSFCNTIPENLIERKKSNFIGKTWLKQIQLNEMEYCEPNTNWIYHKVNTCSDILPKQHKPK